MLCPWGELRRLIDELLPARAVLRELGPLLEGKYGNNDDYIYAMSNDADDIFKFGSTTVLVLFD